MMHLPRISPLDLTLPDKLFGWLDTDPCDPHRRDQLGRRRCAARGVSLADFERLREIARPSGRNLPWSKNPPDRKP